MNILIKLQLLQSLNCKDQLGELTLACASAIWDCYQTFITGLVQPDWICLLYLKAMRQVFVSFLSTDVLKKILFWGALWKRHFFLLVRVIGSSDQRVPGKRYSSTARYHSDVAQYQSLFLINSLIYRWDKAANCIFSHWQSGSLEDSHCYFALPWQHQSLTCIGRELA